MKKLHGVFTALITPFHYGEVDLDRFQLLCQRQLDAGIDGLVPCGTTGETPSLSSKEWSALISIAVKTAAGKVPVIAGCGTNATSTTIQHIHQAKLLGADAALVVFPYYNKPNPDGLRAHVRAACAEDLPVVLYHVPGRTGQSIPASLLAELCREKGVVGLKEASGDPILGQQLLNLLSDTEVSLLSGDDFSFAAMTTMGFDGGISVLSNPAPSLTKQWFAAAEHGDIATIRGLRQQLLPVVEALFASSNPVPCKGIMSAMNLVNNELRLPLTAEPAPDISIFGVLQ